MQMRAEEETVETKVTWAVVSQQQQKKAAKYEMAYRETEYGCHYVPMWSDTTPWEDRNPPEEVEEDEQDEEEEQEEQEEQEDALGHILLFINYTTNIPPADFRHNSVEFNRLELNWRCKNWIIQLVFH